MKLKYRLALILILGFASIAYASSTKFTYIQTNFTAGEFSPKMDGRVDFPKYFNGAKTLDNFIIYPQGGVVRRSGFEYIAAAKTSNEAVRLIPFEFSTTQAYILEFGDKYIRFYMDGGQIPVAADSESKLIMHMDGNQGSVSFPDDGDTGHSPVANGNVHCDVSQSKFSSQSSAFFDGNDYISIPDHADWRYAAGLFTIDFSMKIDYMPSNAVQYLISQYDDADSYYYLRLRDNAGTKTLEWEVNNNGSVDCSVLSTWSTPATNTWYHIAMIRGWDSDTNKWAITVSGALLGSATTAAITIDSFTADLWIGNFNGNTAFGFKGWIEELRVTKGEARWTANFAPPTAPYPLQDGETAYEVTTSYLTEDLPTIKFAQSADTMYLTHEDYEPQKLTRTGHAAWTISDYAPTSDRFDDAESYPAAVGFFEERLVFGGTLDTPQGLFFSVSGDWEDMTEGSSADDAIRIEIAADQVNTIRWLETGRVLVVGTVGGEWKAGASTLDDPLTPTNVTVRRETSYGSANVQPETIGKNVLFVQRAGKKVREFAYNFDVDGYISHDLNILADHIIDSKIVSIAYQQEPYSILWVVTQDGGLYSLTYQKDHEVVAWAAHPVGGTSVDVKSVAVIPGDEEDEVWISVERTLSSVSDYRVNYIERMRPIFSGTDTTQGFFVDSGLSYSGAEVTSVSGLSHLEGETVTVLANGIPLNASTTSTPSQLSLEVASGAITLGMQATSVYAGLGYNSNIETLRVAVPSEKGTIQGKTKRISAVTLRLLETQECKMGPDSDSLVAIDFDDGSTAFSGDKQQEFPGGYETEGYIYIRQDQPLPLTVLAIMPEVRVSD
jgi:hypothetical protein